MYVFDSGDYFDEIHKIYYGGASKNNDGFEIKAADELAIQQISVQIKF